MIFLKRRALMTRASFNYKTVNGIGSITLENCVETKFKRLSLFGNSAQGENPSIESPKEIKNSGKYDETSGKYVIDVGVTGKNLINEEHFFDLRNWTKNLYSVQLVPNTKYTFSRRDNSGYKSGMFLQIKKTVEGPFSQVINTNSELYCKQKVTFTTNETGLIEFQIQNATNINFKDMLGYAQLEKSDVPTPYEPYHEPQTVQLQLDEPLRGIGEYKDVITKDGILRKILQVRIADYLQKDIYGKPGGRYIFSEVPNCYINYDRKRCMSNVGFTTNQENITYMPVPYLDKFKLGVADDDTVETIREKVKDVVVAYTVKEPILEALPTELELALSNLYTNDGTTIINVDSGEVETGIEVEYAVKE